MNSNIAEQCVNRTTFLVGNKKNAGKTTFLNYVLKHVREVAQPAFFTIGIDGETSDLIFETPKPKVHTEVGDYVVTTDAMIEKSNAAFEILYVFPYKTVLGRLVLGKTLRAGHVELIGSEDNSQMAEIVRYLKEEAGIKTIFIDGAASRQTQVAAIPDAHFFYIMNMEHKTINSDMNKFRIVSMCMKYRSFDEVEDVEKKIEEKKLLEIKGALTAGKLDDIPVDIDVLVLDDFTKIFLDFVQLSQLSKRLEIVFKMQYKLLAFVTIFKDIRRSEFEALLEKHSIKENVLYNPYEH